MRKTLRRIVISILNSHHQKEAPDVAAATVAQGGIVTTAELKRNDSSRRPLDGEKRLKPQSLMGRSAEFIVRAWAKARFRFGPFLTVRPNALQRSILRPQELHNTLQGFQRRGTVASKITIHH